MYNRITALKIYVTLIFLLITGIATVYAAPKSENKSSKTERFEDDVVFTAKPAKKEAIFGSGERIVYDVELKNNTNNDQKGNVGYTIYSWKDQVIKQDSVHVKLDKNGKKSLSLRMPSQSPGMYKVNITVNVTDYDDTIRRVFAVDPKKIKSDFAKPGDFDGFWQSTIDTLNRTPMQAKVTLLPSLEKDGISCYLVELHSYGNVVVRGWLTVPKEHKLKDKLAVWLVLPGYGPRGVKPIYGTSDLAVFALNVRGVGNSRDRINPTEEAYVSVGIESKWKYIYRGVIMDCMRAVDYIASRSDFDQDNILCSGASMGGYLSIAVSSLDHRIKLCSANNPVFCDYRSLVGSKEWPMKSFVKYGRERRVGLDRILNTLDYYDLKNFAPNLQCKALIGIGLLDNLAPAYNEYVMLGNLKNNYKLFVYPELAHEVPPEIYSYLSKWMMDQFGLF